MKKNRILLVALFATFIGSAQTYQWAKRIAGTGTLNPSFDVHVTDIIASVNGNSYVSGKFSGTVDFDPSAMISNKTAVGSDGFIAKYSPAGNLEWVYTTNLSGDEEVAAISFYRYTVPQIEYLTAVVKLGNNAFLVQSINRADGTASNASAVFTSTGTVDIKEINDKGYLVGGFTGTLTLDPISLTSNGLSDGFCVRFTATGTTYNVTAAKSYGGTGDDIFNCIGNLYIGGSFTGSINLDVVTKTSAGGKDGFFFKINNTTLYAESAFTTKTIGGSSDDEILSIADAYFQNNIYNVAIGGYFMGTAAFNIGSTTSLVSAGGKDGFIASYGFDESTNTYTGTGLNKQGTLYDDQITNLSCSTPNSRIYFCGKYGNASGGSEGIVGARDRINQGALTYLGKYTPTAATATVNPKAVYFLDSNMFYAGDFSGDTDFDAATATTSILTGNGGGTNAFLQRTSFCTESGDAAVYGDTNICLGESTRLTVNASINGNLDWNWYTGGCASGTIIGTGVTITVTPTAALTGYTARAKGGCSTDGQCAISIFINATSTSNAITVSGNTITADEVGGHYQWLDCNNGNANIVGATSQSFTPSVPGNYAVKVTNISGCQVISVCTQMTLSLEDRDLSVIRILPNPATSYFSISANNEISRVIIFNMLGQKVKEFTKAADTYDISDLSPGNYIVKMPINKGFATQKLVKI